MNNMMKVGLLTVALGLTLHASEATAAVASYVKYSNAVNYCQAFTPGPSNTIRNRVIGSENIGTTIAVACNFELLINGAPGNTNLQTVTVFFTNNAVTANTVTCTLLTGTSVGIGGAGAQYAVTKTTESIAAGAATALAWSQTDNPTPASVDLGSLLVGVNCNLPTNVTMSTIRTTWRADNGV